MCIKFMLDSTEPGWRPLHTLEFRLSLSPIPIHILFSKLLQSNYPTFIHMMLPEGSFVYYQYWRIMALVFVCDTPLSGTSYVSSRVGPHIEFPCTMRNAIMRHGFESYDL